MQKLITRIILLLAFTTQLNAQNAPSGPPKGGFDPSKMNIARVYGKIVDEAGKGVGYATVQVFGKKFDPATRSLRDTLWAGQLTEDNGDFNIEKLPMMGDFELVINFLGYAQAKQSFNFGMSAPKTPPSAASGPPSGMPGGGFPGMGMGNSEKDLGNIKLKTEAKTLNEVTITDKASVATLALDRKAYRVDKDLTSAGGTAEDALKNVPSVSVDLDGNVSLRNGSPQIFVDGRPTTLTLNQISADAIESVEVITNPSSKYDAGGGTAGIINIVLKKEKRLGYNGNVRTGTDSRGGFNFGGDINARGSKVNVFGSLMAMRNRGKSDGETLRENFFGNPTSNLTQVLEGNMRGMFANGRAGVDLLLDNRNTLTFSGSYVRGKFSPFDDLTTTTDFLFPGNTVTSEYVRNAEQDRNFRNLGLTTQFKHLFPKKGAEWTADLNFNQVKFRGGSDFMTTFDNGSSSRERQRGTGQGSFVTFQTDFVNPLKNNFKLEGGLRMVMRNNRNDNSNSLFDTQLNDWRAITQLSDHFKFDDDIYAGYLQLGKQGKNWGFQVGLRAESSFYQGSLTDRDSSFAIIYPISLFPTFFLTHKLNEQDQIQLAYTRRVNRPNFFQTMPFTDFSDSLNLRRGNPSLLPEFTNSAEISYQNIFAKKHNLLISVYYKQANNLIASYQFTEFNADLNKEVVITSFANSNRAAAYGAEFTLKNSFFGWLDLTTNLNIFQADVDASNVETDLKVSRTSGFLKEIVQIKLPKGFALQFNGEYRSRASFTPSTNNDPFQGGGPAAQNTAQGYTKGFWFLDASVRKELLKGQGNLTLSAQDIFKTRRMGSYTLTDFFSQETSRIMNPQMLRLNFSYRFGKMDASLFNRKNNRMNGQGNDMM
jgi:outer membrane receptor protein involved in Fe transport